MFLHACIPHGKHPASCMDCISWCCMHGAMCFIINSGIARCLGRCLLWQLFRNGHTWAQPRNGGCSIEQYPKTRKPQMP